MIDFKIDKELSKSKLIRELFGLEDKENKDIKPIQLKDKIYFDTKIITSNKDKISSLVKCINDSTTKKFELKKVVKKITSASYSSKNESNNKIQLISKEEDEKKNLATLSNISNLNNKVKNEDTLFIPCINCNNLININLIDAHTNTCFSVNEEVKKIEEANLSFQQVDFKLKKLLNHLLQIYDGTSANNDSHYLHILIQSMKDTLDVNKITNTSLTLLKKLTLNLEVSIINKEIYLFIRLYLLILKGLHLQ